MKHQGGENIENENLSDLYVDHGHNDLHPSTHQITRHIADIASNVIVQVMLIAAFGCAVPYIILTYSWAGFLTIYGSLMAIELYVIYRRERPYTKYLNKILKRDP